MLVLCGALVRDVPRLTETGPFAPFFIPTLSDMGAAVHALSRAACRGLQLYSGIQRSTAGLQYTALQRSTVYSGLHSPLEHCRLAFPRHSSYSTGLGLLLRALSLGTKLVFATLDSALHAHVSLSLR